MLATFAFDVCHDVYRAAREVIDTKIPTLNMESSGKYMWRPDRAPRLAEYVSDFARAGERALSDGSFAERRGRGQADASHTFAASACHPSFKASLSRMALTKSPSVRHLRASPSVRHLRASPSVRHLRASRMAMFRVYYLGGAEYQAARRHLGISELTWADWAEEIRTRVGRELANAGVFPPSKYFLSPSVPAPGNAA
jgi:hypothetical protein